MFFRPKATSALRGREPTLEIDAFLPKSDRRALAASLNTLLASPTFASWRQGATLDVESWMRPQHGRTPTVVVSVAHLDDEERALVLGVFPDPTRLAQLWHAVSSRSLTRAA